MPGDTEEVLTNNARDPPLVIERESRCHATLSPGWVARLAVARVYTRPSIDRRLEPCHDNGEPATQEEGHYGNGPTVKNRNLTPHGILNQDVRCAVVREP